MGFTLAEEVVQVCDKTVSSRVEIGFPKHRSGWSDAPAVYTSHELRIAGHPVMEDWEDDYMAVLAGIAGEHGGRVLEVGYGLGLSAGHLLANPLVTEHWIIECHPAVLQRAAVALKDEISAGRVHLLSGFWEDVVGSMTPGQFDGVLFDTYPLTADEIHGNHFPFFPAARRLLRNGGTFTYYSDEVDQLSASHVARLRAHGFREIDWKTVAVSPPTDCEYWQADSIVAPIVRL